MDEAKHDDVAQADSSEQPASTKKKGKLEALMVEYGAIALAVYLVIYLIAIVALSVAVASGWGTDSIDGVAEGAGFVAIVWAGLKITQIGRIALTAVLTPVVARYWRKWFSRG